MDYLDWSSQFNSLGDELFWSKSEENQCLFPTDAPLLGPFPGSCTPPKPPTPPSSPGNEAGLDQLLETIPEILEVPSCSSPNMADIINELQNAVMVNPQTMDACEPQPMQVKNTTFFSEPKSDTQTHKHVRNDIMWGEGLCCAKDLMVKENGTLHKMTEEDWGGSYPETPSGSETEGEGEEFDIMGIADTIMPPTAFCSKLMNETNSIQCGTKSNANATGCGTKREATSKTVTNASKKARLMLDSNKENTHDSFCSMFNDMNSVLSQMKETNRNNLKMTSSVVGKFKTACTGALSSTCVENEEQKHAGDHDYCAGNNIQATNCINVKLTQAESDEEVEVCETPNSTATQTTPVILSDKNTAVKQQQQHTTVSVLGNRNTSTTQTTATYLVSASQYRTRGKPEAYTKRMREYHTEVIRRPKYTRRRNNNAVNSVDPEHKAERSQQLRSVHNSLERQRRVDLKNLFEYVRSIVPEISVLSKAPKVVILRKAAAYCTQLQQEEQRLEQEKELLTKRMAALKYKLRLRTQIANTMV